LKQKKAKEEFQRVECEGVLNIKSLAIRSSSDSSSFLEYIEGKAYNEKIKFVETIIHDIDQTRTLAVEFLHRSRRR